jgi:hypothetical protein
MWKEIQRSYLGAKNIDFLSLIYEKEIIINNLKEYL